MKTCQMPIKKNIQKRGGEKGTRWKDPNPGIKKDPPTRANYKGNMNESSTQAPPPFTRSIIDKEKEGTHEKTFSLEEPSPTTTTCLEIEVALVYYNITNTFYTSHT